MADLRTILIALSLVAYTSAATMYFAYQGNYPIVYFEDFKYVPTSSGYILRYVTDRGVAHEEIGTVPDGALRDNPDTLGSSKEGRLKSSKLPLKNRKISPKLLGSLSG